MGGGTFKPITNRFGGIEREDVNRARLGAG
jgi:hypothetical protein